MWECIFKRIRLVASRIEQILARGLCCASDTFHVDINQLPLMLSEPTSNHDSPDITPVGHVYDISNCVVRRERGDAIRTDHDQIRLLARCQASYVAFEPHDACTVNCCGLQNRLYMDRRGRRLITGLSSPLRERALLGKRDMHLAEHVSTLGRVNIDSKPGAQTVIKRRLIREAIGFQPEQRIRARVHCDVYSRIRKDLPVIAAQAATVIEDVVRTEHPL